MDGALNRCNARVDVGTIRSDVNPGGGRFNRKQILLLNFDNFLL